jgi:hypothetical protein
VVVRCTKQVLDLLGPDVPLSAPALSDDEWYLNLLWIDRRKCLLLTHSGTLFSVFRAGIRATDLRPLGDYIVEAIDTELRAEQLPAVTFAQLDPTDDLGGRGCFHRTRSPGLGPRAFCPPRIGSLPLAHEHS